MYCISDGDLLVVIRDELSFPEKAVILTTIQDILAEKESDVDIIIQIGNQFG